MPELVGDGLGQLLPSRLLLGQQVVGQLLHPLLGDVRIWVAVLGDVEDDAVDPQGEGISCLSPGHVGCAGLF